MESKKLDVVLYCDGACRGNPGPSSFGVLARLSDHTELGRGGMYLGSGTNNSAEWHGAVAALQLAKDVLDSPTGSAVGRVVLRMDSMLVVKQLTGEWKIKEPRLKIFYDQAKAILGSFSVPVKFEWVPRQENGEADAIANQCLDERSTVGLKTTSAVSASPSSNEAEGSEARRGRKSRRIQFSIDEDTYTAFQRAVHANQSTTDEVLVEAVRRYLDR